MLLDVLPNESVHKKIIILYLIKKLESVSGRMEYSRKAFGQSS